MRTINITAVLLAVLLAAPLSRAELEIENAWIRVAPPGTRTFAGYATVTNNGPEIVTILAAESKDFGVVEMHETRETAGIGSMHRLLRVEIPAGETQLFKPGGLHFMLMNPNRVFHEGTIIIIELVLEHDVHTSAAFVMQRDSAQ